MVLRSSARLAPPSLSLTDLNINYGATTSSVERHRSMVHPFCERKMAVVTTIASSTDNLILETIDVELANVPIHHHRHYVQTDVRGG